MEPIPMLAKKPKKTRAVLLAAACVALVGAGASPHSPWQDDDPQPPAPSQTVRSTATITSEAQTPNPTAPATTAPGIIEPSTIAPTTIPRISTSLVRCCS